MGLTTLTRCPSWKPVAPLPERVETRHPRRCAGAVALIVVLLDASMVEAVVGECTHSGGQDGWRGRGVDVVCDGSLGQHRHSVRGGESLTKEERDREVVGTHGWQHAPSAALFGLLEPRSPLAVRPNPQLHQQQNQAIRLWPMHVALHVAVRLTAHTFRM